MPSVLGITRAAGAQAASAALPRLSWQHFLLEERGAAERYTIAGLLVSAAFVLAQCLNQVEGVQLSFLPFTAVVLTAIYGGTGPALIAALVSAVGVDYFFADPVMRVFDSWTSWLRVLSYGCVSVLIANIVSSLRCAYRELHAQHLRTEEEKRARENILSIVSHDLRAPLAAVLMSIGHVKLALKIGAPAPGIASTLEGMHRSAQRMRRLVDDLLDAAKVQSGRLTIKPARHRALDILEDAVEGSRLAAEGKGVRLELDFPVDEIFLHCDRERMHQVLCNLIGNAIKFSPDGAAVAITLCLTDAGVRIDIRDHGPGIAASDLPKLYTPYWQATDSAHLGTGLGLFIARSIVEAHGGRIELTSEAGCGATFGVLLPTAI